MEIRTQIEKLVKEEGSQAKVARLLKMPRSTLNEYLHGKHLRNAPRIEKMFEVYLYGVDCPVLGRIKRETCEYWFNKPFIATNSFNAKIYKACRNCLQGLCNNRKD